MEDAASQIPADCNLEVYDEGFWSRVDVWAGQFGLTRTRWHCAGIRGARGPVMAWPRLAMALPRLVV